MKLTVPFIPDKKYIHFLKEQTSSIESIYFPLYSGAVLDARMRFKKTPLHELSKGLQQIESVKKYCLLNSRFIHPMLYHDALFLNQLLDTLEFLFAASQINGIVFSDAYFLTAMTAEKREIIRCLEAVPGINCMIDSSEKAFSFFDLVEQTGFKLPEKLVLDRSLNRNIPQLEKTGTEIKQRYGPVKIELIANEGCIYHCPFKLTHDAQIAFSNTGCSPDKTFQINQSIGCHSYFFKRPETFFKSPFIRPEDLDEYTGVADTIKLCGRTLGANFLSNCINAYSKKSYRGNLLDLMDAACWLADTYHIENKRLDPGFFNMLTNCTKVCKNCKTCKDLFLKAAQKKPFKIKLYEDCL